MRDITSVMGTIETEARGVTVQASTLGKRRDSSHCLLMTFTRCLCDQLLTFGLCCL